MQNHNPAALQQLRSRRLTGTPEQVRNAVARYQATGQLADLTAPQPVPGRPGLICMDVRIISTFTDQPVPTVRPRPRRRRRWPYILAAVIAVLGLLAWGVYTLVTAVAAAVGAAGPALAVLALAAVIVAAAGTRTGRKTCTTIVTVTHKH
jgi:hypothetical protein